MQKFKSILIEAFLLPRHVFYHGVNHGFLYDTEFGIGLF